MILRKLFVPGALLAATYVLRTLLRESDKPRESRLFGAPSPTPQMQAVLDTLASLGGKPIETLSPEEARVQPTPADAVVNLLQAEGLPDAPESIASVASRSIPGPYGDIPLHIYTPEGKALFPVIVYFHGGGFVMADTKAYEASIRALANATGAIVVSVDYRRAPEYKFPVAADEAYAAYNWVTQNAQSLDGDPKRVAVAGESAGGNLALVVSMKARDDGMILPLHELLIYPVVDNNFFSASYIRHAWARPLNRDMMKWFFGHYLRSQADTSDRYALPAKASTLRGLPATTIITAQIDPLQSEGLSFAERLKNDGVAVAYSDYPGVTHEFFGMGAVLSEARDAQDFAATELRKAFANLG